MRNTRGQTALILILLTAVALIFLAISLNWGRIAQTKAMLTIGADEAATLLASYGASYGEMQKQTYLHDTNKLTFSTGLLEAIFMVVLAVIGLIITILTPGVGFFAIFLSAMSVVFSVTNIVLQAVVVQPMITNMWNNMMKNQPQTEQFFEQGILTGLQSTVTDQVNLADYLDWNANGYYGVNAQGLPNDYASRFAVFYTDRIKMLQVPMSRQVKYFYNKLGELVNGENCAQNEADASEFPDLGATENSYCSGIDAANGGGHYCINNPSASDCTKLIPWSAGGFQLTQPCGATITCSDGSTCTANKCANGNYCGAPPSQMPYCNSCCQPNPPAGCGGVDCTTNNPYGAAYPGIYDPTFQSYQNNQSFLAQLGRDQQTEPAGGLMSPNVVIAPGSSTPALEFPNGIYPLFWMMNNYGLEVDNLDRTNFASAGQYHWCTAAATPAYTSPQGVSPLAQLSLPYICAGQDCCVNQITGTINASSVSSQVVQVTLQPGPAVTLAVAPNQCLMPGSNIALSGTASENAAAISLVYVFITFNGVQSYVSVPIDGSGKFSYTISNAQAGTYSLFATATDNNGVTGQSSTITPTVGDDAGPTVILADPGALKAGTYKTLTATADPAPGIQAGITSVTFEDNNGAFPPALGSPNPVTSPNPGTTDQYSYTNQVPAGTAGTPYSLTAVAVDACGKSAASSPAITGTVQ